jgi:hypothetical protein
VVDGLENDGVAVEFSGDRIGEADGGSDEQCGHSE